MHFVGGHVFVRWGDYFVAAGDNEDANLLECGAFLEAVTVSVSIKQERRNRNQ